MPSYATKKCKMCGRRIGLSMSLTGKFKQYLNMKQRGYIKKSLCGKCFMVMFGSLYGRYHRSPTNSQKINFEKIKEFIEEQEPKKYSYTRRI